MPNVTSRPAPATSRQYNTMMFDHGHNMPPLRYVRMEENVAQQETPQLQEQSFQQEQEKSPDVQPEYIIRPPSMHRAPSNLLLPSFLSPRDISLIIENSIAVDDAPDLIRMLVLLESGEQRYLSFTLPEEEYDIREILEQIGVDFKPDTHISCHEVSFENLHYIVLVGKFPNQNSVRGIPHAAVVPQSTTEPDLTSQPKPSSSTLLTAAELPPGVPKIISNIKEETKTSSKSTGNVKNSSSVKSRKKAANHKKQATDPKAGSTSNDKNKVRMRI